MDSVVLQSPMEERSPEVGIIQETEYEPLLRESVKRFIAGIHGEGFDFAGFRSVISRQLQSSADPPLEILWLYSAASYHESISAKGSFDRVHAVRDLLQLLSTFSAASGGPKCIALIAPAVYGLYQCAVDGFAEKKEMKEIDCLADGILSYISICSGHCSALEEISAGLHPCFIDLVKVWTMKNSDSVENLEEFFPLISSKIRRKFEVEGCGVDFLAGVVIAEAFFLRLCLKVKGGGASRKELQKELGIWAVSSITVFRNHNFFEILLKLLLDPKAIPATLLNAEDEKLVRGVLYDAVVLVDYSFLISGNGMDQSGRFRNLHVAKLFVTNDAVKLARTSGEHSKALSYVNAFSTSSLPSEIIKWVRRMIGDSSFEHPNHNSPECLLKWLIHLEQMGKRIFEDEEASRYAVLLILDKPSPIPLVPASVDSRKTDADLFFFDNGEPKDEEMESVDALFSSAAQSMRDDGRVKRKEPTDEAAGKRCKYFKYDIQNTPFESSDNPIIESDDCSENQPSDADMEELD